MLDWFRTRCSLLCRLRAMRQRCQLLREQVQLLTEQRDDLRESLRARTLCDMADGVSAKAHIEALRAK